jgi:menaquinone-9 beta-reductase
MIENSIEIPLETPVCIVGAGPAGATTALFLAKMGIPHLLIDKDTFPRDKICGDGLDLKVMRVLNLLEKDLANELLQEKDTFSQSWGIRIISPNIKVKDFVYSPKAGNIQFPMFCVAKREKFDFYLLKKLNKKYTAFHQKTELKSVERVDNGVELTLLKDGKEHKVFTKLLIGADGEHSIISKKFNNDRIDRNHYAAALRQYYKGIEGCSEHGLIEVYFSKMFPIGYFWIFPLPNGEANVGFGMQSDMISKKKVNLKKSMDFLIKNDPYLANRFKNAVALESPKGWGLPLASKRLDSFGDNYLLVGDAASLICPLTGEGIGTAMMSGYMAAKYIENAIKNDNYSADSFKNFKKDNHKRIEKDIKVFNFIRLTKPEIWLNKFMNVYSFMNFDLIKGMPEWLETAFSKDIEVEV